MPHSSVAVRMKISFSSSRILRAELQRPHHDEIGEERGDKTDRHAERRADIGPGVQIVAGGPGGDDGRHHQRAMRQIEHAGNAENKRKPRGAERVERTDREAVDQDLPEQRHQITLRKRAGPIQENSPLAGAGGEYYERVTIIS